MKKILAPLYKPNKKNEKRNIPIKDKNMEFRQNEENYITILMRLDYFYDMLEKHTSKFNRFWIMCSAGVFCKFFPNIANLFMNDLFLQNLFLVLKKVN